MDAQPAPLWSPAALRSDSLSDGDTYDAVIVGAGIVGLTTALLAARAGMRVGVVEAREPGAGASGRSSAKATLLQGVTASGILRMHGEDVMRAYLDANRAGQELLRSHLIDSSVPWSQRDAWTYAADQQAAVRVQAEAAALRRSGIEASIESTGELPFATWGGVRLPDQLQLDPAAYLGWLVEQARQEGAGIEWPLRALAVERAGPDELVVDCGDRRLRATWVVLATLLPFPLRTLMFAVATPRRSYVVSGWADRPDRPQGMYLSVGDLPTRSLRTATDPAGREVLLVGGYGHPTGKGLPASGHLQQLREWGLRHFGVPGEQRAWSAQDYLSADLLPHIGPMPRAAPGRLLFACGFSKWGITNGSAAAIALVGTMRDREPGWALALRPRIPHGSGGPALMKNNLSVGLGLVRGWTLDPGRRGAIAEGEGEVVRRVPAPVAVSRVGGRLRACSAVCTHLGGVVRFNDVEKSWDCPLHGSRFAPDGSVLEGPAVAALPRRPVSQG